MAPTTEHEVRPQPTEPEAHQTTSTPPEAAANATTPDTTARTPVAREAPPAATPRAQPPWPGPGATANRAKGVAEPATPTGPAPDRATPTTPPEFAVDEPVIQIDPLASLISVPPGPLTDDGALAEEPEPPVEASTSRDESAAPGDAPNRRARPSERAPLGSARPIRGRRLPSAVEPPAARTWRWPQRLGLVAAVLALLVVGAVTLLPVWLLERSDEQARRCLAELVRTAEGDPAQCVPSGWQAELPSRLPWLAVEADGQRAAVELEVARLAYDRATAIAPDRQRRDVTAQHLLELTHGLVPPAGSEAAVTMLPGAFATVARFASERDEKSVRSWAFEAARATAALPLLRQLGPRGDAGEPWARNLERGALVCLLGDHAAGMASLQAADATFRASSEHGDGLDPARLAMIACRPPARPDAAPATEPTALAIDPRQVRPRSLALLTALESSLELEGATEEALRLMTEKDAVATAAARLRLLPWALRAIERPGLADVLALAQPASGPAASADPTPAATPWVLLDRRSSESAMGLDPVAAQSLATDLEAMVANLPAKRDEPVACAERGCASDSARGAPAEALSRLSRDLWFECAAEWARRGDRDQTLSALARYRAIEPAGPAPELAALLLAVRDADGALGVLDADQTEAGGPTAVTRRLRTFEADVNRTLALAHLGRFHEAFTAAERLWSRAESSEDRQAANAPGATEGQTNSRKAAAAWLLAAMAGHVGREREVLGRLPAPPAVTPGQRPEPESPLAEVALWLSLGLTEPMSEAERRPLRWRLALRATRDGMVTAVLPAVMDLASRAVPENADVEVWLDRLFDEDHRTHPVLVARARAEAARWRGDGLGAVDWETRAAVLLRLSEGLAGALLGHYAGLR